MTGGLQQVYRLKFLSEKTVGMVVMLQCLNLDYGCSLEVCKRLSLPSSIKILTGHHYEVIDPATGHAECHSKDRDNFPAENKQKSEVIQRYNEV